MSRLDRRRPFVLHAWLPVVLPLLLAACGGGGGGDTAGGPISLTGTLAVVESAALPSTSTSPVAVVAVDESGRAADAAVTRGDFELHLPPGHDYCLVFRRRRVDGATLGVLLIPPSGRAVFHLAEGTAPIDLGRITLHTASGRAESTGALPSDTVAPATAYGDIDHDRIPDAMDRDDDGDGVADTDDCAARDARRSVTLTTGACVEDDDNDDNDTVIDLLDAAPLDPAVQVDEGSDPDVVRLVGLLGRWTLSFTILGTPFVDAFDFDLVQENKGSPFASGINEYGDVAVLNTADTAGYDYAIYTEGVIIGEVYFLYVNGTTVTGDYWQTDLVTGEITSSRAYAITGSHTLRAVASSAVQSSGESIETEAARVALATTDLDRVSPPPGIREEIDHLRHLR